MLKVTLEGSSLTLDLNEISASGAGAQAIAGLLGFGLPPVDVQWTEGAGDGATHRSTRALPRDVDLPIHITASNRAALKAKLKTFARIMAGKIMVKVHETDDNTFVWADFYRVGGGTYTYGGDSDQRTTGETEWESIVTLRAGSPYWLHQSLLTSVTTGTTQQFKTLNNPGTAESIPVFRLTGPASGVDLTGPDGSKFSWTGNLLTGSTLTIDPASGTVVDQLGNRLYDGLSYAPKFWRIPPGASSATVKINPRTPSTRRNYEPNPTFGTNSTSGWTADTGYSGTTISASGNRLLIGVTTGAVGPHNRARRTISGLPAGTDMVLRMKLQRTNAYAGVPRVELYGTGLSLAANGPSDGSVGEVVIPFTVPGSGSIAIVVQATSVYFPGTSGVEARQTQVAVDDIYVGVPGSYFSGASAATSGETYSWSGVAHSSQSIATESTSGAPSLTIEWRPRDWMVV